MTTIGPTAAATTPTPATTTPTGTTGTTFANPSSDLSKNQFLQLMVTQLQYQDPTSPSDSTDYLSQLAQFTSLEQETNTATSTESSETLALLGHTVTYTANDGSPQSGTVTGVDMTGTSPTITVGTATGIDPTKLTQVS